MTHANSYATVTEQVDLSAHGDMRAQVSVESGYQPALERDVVVRRLRPSAADARLRGRFLREVKLLAQLRHHSFVHVYDAGVKDDVPFAVFERLQGITAQHRVELLADRQARMELQEAVWIVENVARAVSYARRQGVQVHDVTAANIVLADGQRVVLTGLGEPLPENPLTASAAQLAYAAPERLFGAAAAGDELVYGLGVLLAHLVFGRLPFEGTPLGIIAQKQQLETLPVLSDPGVSLKCPYPLARLMHRAAAADPRERIAGVEQFIAELLDAASAGPRERAVGAAPQAVYAYGEQTLGRPLAPVTPLPARHAAAGAGWLAGDFVDETSALRVVRAAAPVAREVGGGVAVHVAAEEEPPLAREVGAVRAAPVAAVDAGADAAEESYDPLMPGLDNPALAAALPFTVLVPMLDDADAALTRHSPLQSTVFAPRYVLALMVLCVLAIGAAMMFG